MILKEIGVINTLGLQHLSGTSLKNRVFAAQVLNNPKKSHSDYAIFVEVKATYFAQIGDLRARNFACPKIMSSSLDRVSAV
jgi:hypothetical protein